MANKTIIQLNPVTPSSTTAIPIYENGSTGRASASEILKTQDILYADDEQEPTSAVSFESVDTELTPASSESVELLNGSDTWGSRFYKISQMFKNVRYLLSKLGTTDFSSIGNTTVTGALKALDTRLTVETASLNLNWLNMNCKRIGDIKYIRCSTPPNANMSANTEYNIGTLPVNFRPSFFVSYVCVFNPGSLNNIGVLKMTQQGAITFTPNVAVTTAAAINIHFAYI